MRKGGKERAREGERESHKLTTLKLMTETSYNLPLNFSLDDGFDAVFAVGVVLSLGRLRRGLLGLLLLIFSAFLQHFVQSPLRCHRFFRLTAQWGRTARR